MKYAHSMIIDVPLDKLVDLWQDEDNLKHWQDNFESIELLEGKKNTEGAVSFIKLGGSRPMELKETIQSINLPHEKRALYQHIHMDNTHITKFKAISDSQTEYSVEGEYIKFHSFMPRMMALLFPDMFRKQSKKWMDQFKAFAEAAAKS